MDSHYFEVANDLDKKGFNQSYNIMESYCKKEEAHDPGVWQVCCLFNAAKAKVSVWLPASRPRPWPTALPLCVGFSMATILRVQEVG